MTRRPLRYVEDIPGGPFATVPTSEESTAGWRTIRPVIHLDRCTRCNVCWKFCPDVAVGFDPDGYPMILYDACKGCGICANECAPKAITMEREE